MTVIICLPIKNEEKILKNNVEMVLRYLSEQNLDFNWQVVIVVNGSIDSSLEIAQAISKRHERVDYLNIDQSGKGRAVKYCFDKYVRRADYLMYMDIDLAVSLSDLKPLFREIYNYDLVFGSRLMPGSITDRSWFREISSRVYNYISRLILKHSFLDLQCGFKIIKKEAYQSVRKRLEDNNWFFDSEWVIMLYRLGFKLKEIPVHWQENRYQKRSSRVNIFKDTFKFLLALKKLYFRLKS
jgi:glycosyltransferase involved in cell wall biosynthesis